MSLVNIMFCSNRTFCFSQNQTIYSVAFLVTAWLVIVEGFALGEYKLLYFVEIDLILSLLIPQ